MNIGNTTVGRHLPEPTDDAFAGDVLTPEQCQPQHADTPEQRLVRSVLNDGLLCWLGIGEFLGHNPSLTRSRERARAQRWVACRDSERPYAFEWCCAELALSAAAIREGLARPRLALIVNSGTARDFRRRKAGRHHARMFMPRHARAVA